ncbi:MAG: glycosyltransferase family 61 protein, partial [Rhizorhabdus sp.]
MISDRVRPSEPLEIFSYRAPAKFTAPDIEFSAPQPLMVRGGSFTVVAERTGVVPGSTYLWGGYNWTEVFAPAARTVELPSDAALVAGNAAAHNYYHWTIQCLAPILIAHGRNKPSDMRFIVGSLTPAYREGLDLAGVDARLVHELHPEDLAIADQGIYTNLTTGAFAFTPHPAIDAAFGPLADRVARSRFAGRKVFVSRADSTNRCAVNEEALSEALVARGFDVVLLTTMPLAEQIGLFRDAAVIVAQHGAGLTNLVYAATGGNGPAVVELHQENYLQQAFLKLCQLKRLNYTAVINPM